MMKKTYRHDDTNHPLVEATYDTAFKVYKTDRNKAIIGDPENCIEARGLQRLPNVAFAHIGSGGDAYVGFKEAQSPTGVIVHHFNIKAKAAQLRDAFEVKGAVASQIVMLNAPTKSGTLAHRASLQTRRRAEIKAGAVPIKRGPQKSNRTIRLGVPPRPRAKLVKGEVSVHAAA